MARDRASRPEAKAHRLFVAFSIPQDAKTQIADAVAPWLGAYPRARWVPPENWHVTLKFLGATFPRLIERVQTQVGDVAEASAPFRTRVEGLGAFPTPHRARVLWAGLKDPGGLTAQIVSDLNDALGREFPAETRAFHPHLTVARSNQPIDLPEGFAKTGLRTEEFRVDRLVLFRSHLRRPAPYYEKLASFGLGRL